MTSEPDSDQPQPLESDGSPRANAQPRPHNPWPWIFLIILVLAGLFVVWQMILIPQRMVAETGAAAQRVADTFGQWIEAEPRVTETGRVTFEKPEALFELAVVESTTTVESSFLHSHFLSKKQLQARGVFEVKVGYDLEESMAITTDPADPRRILVHMPPPKILSLTQTDYQELEYREGLWNKMTPRDREAQVEKLAELAYTRASESGLLDEARQRLEDRLQQTIGDDYRVDVVEGPAATRLKQ